MGAPVESPVQVKNISNVRGIAAGNIHSFAIGQDGTVWGWGANTDGTIGDGFETTRKTGSGEALDNQDRAVPVQVRELKQITKVVANFAASFALKEDGTVWGWGFISVPYTKIPARLIGWTDMTDIATGYTGNLLAVKSDGTVWTNGKNGLPAQVEGLSDIVKVAASSGSSYALKNDGTVWAWGQNYDGRLGDGTTVAKEAPTRNPFLQNVADISATSGGAVYLLKDGTVWANGTNRGGQLGIGSYEDSSIPVQVKGLTHITQISSSTTGNSVMALRGDQTLWSWGDGYVGDGTEWWRTVPVMIKSYENQILEDIDTIKVDINGKAIRFDHSPVLIFEKTMVPMRKIFEVLGATLEWEQSTSTVHAIRGQTRISLKIGDQQALVNGAPVELDAAAVILNDSTFVPVRFIAESLGTVVAWDDVTKTVKITTPSTGK